MDKQTSTPQTRIFNLLILDESGSMSCIEKQAIDGVNETIQCIRKAQKGHPEQTHFFTFVTFNDDVKTICNCMPAEGVKEITSHDYNPNCCTALYDAIGFSANNLKPLLNENDKVLVTIVTDGYENASTEYTGAAIKSLIDDLKSKNWVFTYMGANHDVESAALNISITNTLKFESTVESSKASWDKMNAKRMNFYERASRIDYDCDAENEDFFNR